MMPTRFLASLERWGIGSRRAVFFLLGDAALLALSLIAAAWLPVDGAIPAEMVRRLPTAIAISLLAKLATFIAQGLYSLNWEQVGLEDMVTVFRCVTVGSAVFWLSALGLGRPPFLAALPRSVLLIDYLLSMCAVGAIRIGHRLHQHLTHPYQNGGQRALILGAGVAGEQLARSLRYTAGSGYAPVGFIDDHRRKWGTVIHGLRVFGGLERLPEVITERKIKAILIAVSSSTSSMLRAIISTAHQAGVRDIRIVPSPDATLNGRVSFTDLREVQPADLLGREVVRIDTAAIERWTRGCTVLVTGAAGSIGFELCRQLVRFRPRELVLMDCNETGLFDVDQEMRRLGQRAMSLLVDIRDAGAVHGAFRAHRPHVVFHAAAYKHVGMMERQPEQAVSVNVLGTWVVAEAAAEAAAERFVLISSDKAVNPTSVMGASKRVAEQICLAFNERGPTQYLGVRFGNVLGSRGSVVPLFQDRIRRGEPLTIRGANMRRYFMTPSEAVLLVLQAGAAGTGGEILVLDMGQPVHIVSLARELIRLSGLDPDKDVPIVFADPEPGEKEHEDLLAAEEGTQATRHERIFVARPAPQLPADTLFAYVGGLEKLVERHDVSGILDTLRALVPTYQPSEFLLSRVAAASSPDVGAPVWLRRRPAPSLGAR
jgi:FlaA1/EpsC-like NDP-sugar epimerase